MYAREGVLVACRLRSHRAWLTNGCVNSGKLQCSGDGNMSPAQHC